MQLFQRYYYYKIYNFFKTDFWLFELSIWLHVFARSMIAVFIPIFLLKMGYAVVQVALYYFIFAVFDFPLNFFARWLTYKIGARKVLIWGSLALVSFFAILYNLTYDNWLLLVAMAFLGALYDALYWIAHIYFFIGCEKNDDNISKGVSFLYIVKRMAGVLAPIFGALILIFLGYKTLIIVSMLILVLSLWPLFKIRETKDRPIQKPLGIRSFFKKWDDLKEYLLIGVYSFHKVAENVIWPIFIFVLFQNIRSVALIPVIVSITTIVFARFTGKVKKADRNKTMAIGAFLVAIIWILRLIVVNNIFYYLSIFLVGLFSIFVSLPLDSNLFEKGEKKDALSAATYRNVFSMFPRILFYGGLYLLLNMFKASFLLAAIAMFVIMAVSYIFMIQSKKL